MELSQKLDTARLVRKQRIKPLLFVVAVIIIIILQTKIMQTNRIKKAEV